MKLKITLSTRFTLWVAGLLIVLVGATLWVIEKREVRTIFEEAKNKGVLIARNLAELNLRSMFVYDTDGIQSSIREQTDDKLLYVVFFDRSGAPIAYNKEIADQPKIYEASRLQGDIRPDSVVVETKDVRFEAKLRPILEIEAQIMTRNPATKWGSIRIGMSIEDMRAEIRRTRLVLILMGIAGFLFGLLGATLLARRVSRPIQKLVEGTVRISKGDFSHRIEINSEDEIGNLARSFNAMTARLLAARDQMEETHKKLIQAEKLASIGRLSVTIAHEIRNPLTSVKLNIQKLVEDGRCEPLEMEHLAISQEGIAQIEKFIKELLSFTRVSELQPAHFSISQILAESVKTLTGSIQEKKITLERKIDEGLPEVFVDGDKMRQVFLNVLRNSLEATASGGNIKITASRTEDGGRPRIKIRISDNGCGIPDKDLGNIFEPFYSTKSSGFGLGLANARKIIEQHRGTIRVVKKRGPGTAFEILVPCEGEP